MNDTAGSKSVQSHADRLPTQEDRLWDAIAMGVVAAMYAIAFFLPVVDISRPSMTVSGGTAFLAWIYRVIEGDHYRLLSWSANPLFWLAFLLFAINWRREALVAGLLAVALAASIWIGLGDRLRVGYYCWLASMILLTILSAVLVEHDARLVNRGWVVAAMVVPFALMGLLASAAVTQIDSWINPETGIIFLVYLVVVFVAVPILGVTLCWIVRRTGEKVGPEARNSRE
jgi:hypothetical protein